MVSFQLSLSDFFFHSKLFGFFQTTQQQSFFMVHCFTPTEHLCLPICNFIFDLRNLPKSHIVSKRRSVIWEDFSPFLPYEQHDWNLCHQSRHITTHTVRVVGLEEGMSEEKYKKKRASTKWWRKWGQTDAGLHLYMAVTHWERVLFDGSLVCVVQSVMCVRLTGGGVLSVAGCDN